MPRLVRASVCHPGALPCTERARRAAPADCDGWEGGASTAAQPPLCEVLTSAAGTTGAELLLPSPRSSRRCWQMGSSRWHSSARTAASFHVPAGCAGRGGKNWDSVVPRGRLPKSVAETCPCWAAFGSHRRSCRSTGLPAGGRFQGPPTPAVSRDGQSPALSWAECREGAEVCTTESPRGILLSLCVVCVQQGCR